ncbi:MAG TPA: hypothetical protein VII41_18455 [Steroidobacteraceae bacterium]
MLIAAGLAATLGVSAAYAERVAPVGALPHGDGGDDGLDVCAPVRHIDAQPLLGPLNAAAFELRGPRR